jgi:flagellar basal-body rod modification protein FlgD
MEIGQVTQAVTGAQSGAQSSGALGKDEFLRLLTAQMTNQDPLEPMDNTEFVAQLAQFSSLEQMMNIGSSVEQLALAQAVANGSNMVSFIGKEVTYMGDGFQVDGSGSHDLAVDLAGDASKVTVSIYDESGELVRSFETGAISEGNQTINWDGTDENGQPVDEGHYTFKVSAEDKDGNAVEITTRQRGKVEGVSYASGYPELVINGERVPVGQVVEVLEGDQVEAPSQEVAKATYARGKRAYSATMPWDK